MTEPSSFDEKLHEVGKDVLILKALFLAFAEHRIMCSGRAFDRNKKSAMPCECGLYDARKYFDKVLESLQKKDPYPLL